MESEQEIDIIITLIAGTAVVLTMAGAVIASVIKYQKNVLKQKEALAETEKKFQIELLDATIIASEKEREVVAKNIHDDLGALTNVIKLNNAQIKNNLQNEAAALDLIKTNNQLLLEINESIRAISNDLASPTLAKYGFFKAIDQLTSQIPNTIKVILKSNKDDARFDKKTEIQLFRTCKEVLTNIIKHSNSNEINININFSRNRLTVSINYNGSGINDEDAKTSIRTTKGLGLKSIYSRIQVLKGSINYFVMSSNESKVLMNIPIQLQTDAK
jgi:signal transduction histidine kinase